MGDGGRLIPESVEKEWREKGLIPDRPLTDEDRQWVEMAAPDSLDAAWAEAEAALPEGVEGLYIERDRLGGRVSYYAGTWIPGTRGGTDAGKGPTPAAALRALIAKLREVGR